MNKILIINGPNLNLLGVRSQKHYGVFNLEQLSEIIRSKFSNEIFEFFQSNIEGDIVGRIQTADENFDGLVINPGGYAHTSVAIKDALEICQIPKIEVHLSHLVNRESFRQALLTASSCDGYISGFKEYSYLSAIYIIINRIAEKTVDNFGKF